MGVGDGVEVVLVVTVAVLDFDDVGEGVKEEVAVSVAVGERVDVGVPLGVSEEVAVPLGVNEDVDERVEVCVRVELQEGVTVFEQLGFEVEPKKAQALGQPHGVHTVAPITLFHVPVGQSVGFNEAKGQ